APTTTELRCSTSAAPITAYPTPTRNPGARPDRDLSQGEIAMDKSIFAAMPSLTPALGFASMVGLGLFSLALSYGIKTLLVRNTHDFIIADRRVGFGFGVGSVIAVWTWAMAVMMSSAMTYKWGLSGLFWFVVPNGFAVIAMIPFARVLRKNMPEGYTISEFIQYRFQQS